MGSAATGTGSTTRFDGHELTEVPRASGLRRLATTSDVQRRWFRPGPHVTVVLPISTPGDRHDDLDRRWSATRTDLAHLGATDTALEHLDRAIEALPRSGALVLLTADEHDAAYCWMATTAVTPAMKVGDVPSLIPALAEVDRRPAAIAAAVDRIGADLYIVDHAHIDHVATIDGEDVGVHKSAGDGWDQARKQRHSEVLWDRNALQVAVAIAEQLDDRPAAILNRRLHTVIALTGDRRATALVAKHVDDPPHVSVHSVEAGSRHDPDRASRLLAASVALTSQVQSEEIGERCERLREELGQQDRAVDGSVHTLDAIAAGRVATLFVDLGRWADAPLIDETIKGAMAIGADIVAAPLPELDDGVAALLRVPYRQEPLP